MLKRSLISLAAVAALSGAVVTPAQAATTKVVGNTCHITPNHEVADFSQIVKEFYALPSIELTGFAKHPILRKDPDGTDQLNITIETAKENVEGYNRYIEQTINTFYGFDAETFAMVYSMPIDDAITMVNFIKDRFIPELEKLRDIYASCVAKASSPTTADPASHEPILDENTNPLIGNDGKLTDSGIAVVVVGVLAGIAALIPLIVSLLAPSLSPFLPML